MIIGLFAMLVAFWWTSAAVLVSYWTVGRLFCAFAFVGNLLYGPWVERLLGMGRGYWFMFNLLFIGPVLFCLFFGVNGLFTSGTRSYIVREPVSGLGIKAHWIEHGELPQVILSSSGSSPLTAVPAGPEMPKYSLLRVSRGCFGFEVLGWRSLDQPPLDDRTPQ